MADLSDYERSKGIGGQGSQGIPTTVTDSNGIVVTTDTNITLALKGDAQLQKRLATGEPRHAKRKDWLRDGMPVTEDATREESLRQTRVWNLTDLDGDGKPCKNFCPDCGSNSINVNLVPGSQLVQMAPGLALVMDNRPDIEMRPGDAMCYWHCGRCADVALKEQGGGDIETGPVLLDQYGNDIGADFRADQLAKLQTEREERMRSNCYQWIKAARLKGLSHHVMGDDVVSEP